MDFVNILKLYNLLYIIPQQIVYPAPKLIVLPNLSSKLSLQTF